VSGVQQLPALQTWVPLQLLLQFMVPPQPLDTAAPQAGATALQAMGMQHMEVPALHTSVLVQLLAQLIVPPQPSGAVPEQLLAGHVGVHVHTSPVQTVPFAQSVSSTQLSPAAHFAHTGPPQSTSVSMPLAARSSHSVASQVSFAPQELLVQSASLRQPSPSAQSAQSAPPQSRSVSSASVVSLSQWSARVASRPPSPPDWPPLPELPPLPEIPPLPPLPEIPPLPPLPDVPPVPPAPM
jgi:hypothetical protein